jgi:hypothetical protein
MMMMMTATPSIAVSKIGHPLKLPGGAGVSSSCTLKFLLQPQNTKAHTTHTHTHTHAYTREHPPTYPSTQTQTERQKDTHTNTHKHTQTHTHTHTHKNATIICRGQTGAQLSAPVCRRNCAYAFQDSSCIVLHGESRSACSRILSSHLAIA